MFCRISLRTVWHARKVLLEYRFCRTSKKTRSWVERGLLLSFLVLQQVLDFFFFFDAFRLQGGYIDIDIDIQH